MSRSAERIVSLLWLLLDAGAIGRTKPEIFSYLYDHSGATMVAKQRQFSRDKQVLTDIGVPVQWRQQSGRDDVYVIDQDRLYLPDLGLADQEVLALHQARALWQRTPIEDAIHTALTRMTASQPDRTPVVGAQLAEDQTLLTALVEAAGEQQPVKFRYRTAAGRTIATRKVRPWAVLMVQQQWYMVGYDLDRDEERIYKLSRIASRTIAQLPADVLTNRDTASSRPKTFDVEAIRQRLRSEQPVMDAYVWLRHGVATSLRIRAEVQAHGSGWDLVHQTTRDPLSLAATIAALVGDARVDADRSPQLAVLVQDLTEMVRDTHHGTSPLTVPSLVERPRTRRRAGDKDVIARRLGIVAVVNQHGGQLDRATIRRRFNITDAVLTEDLTAMQFWGMPETDFAGGQFEVDPDADLIQLGNAGLLAQPWQLSAPEALGIISGLSAVRTIPGITLEQLRAAESLEHKLRAAIDLVAPQVDPQDTIVHPDLRLGDDDETAAVLHRAAQDLAVVRIAYYSASAGTITTREIEPLQLVYSAGHGYVRAWCRVAEDIRTFRIDRIGSASPTGQKFSPHDKRNAVTEITPETAQAALNVVVHVTHRHRDVVATYHPSASASAADGSVFAQLMFRDLGTLLELLMKHPGQITVLQPVTVREQIWAVTHHALQPQPAVGSRSVDSTVE